MENYPSNTSGQLVGLLNSVLQVCSPFGGVVNGVYRAKPQSERVLSKRVPASQATAIALGHSANGPLRRLSASHRTEAIVLPSRISPVRTISRASDKGVR